MAAAEAKVVKPNLRPVATFSTSLEVVSRQWLALILLQLVYGFLPDLLFWLIDGYPPSFMSSMPLGVRLAYLSISYLASAVYDYNATRVTLADQLSGRRLSLRDAATLPPRAVPALLLVTLVYNLPTLLLNSLGFIGNLPIPLYIAAILVQEFLFSVVLSFIGIAVAIIVDEGVGGFTALRRSLEITRGHRVALTVTIFAFGATWFLIQYGVAELVDRIVQAVSPEAPDAVFDFWRGVSWTPFSLVEGLLWSVWLSVLYIALRRAREGVASTSDIALFE
jgi:hypothetical protein